MNIVTDGASAAMGIERYSIVKSHVGLDERIRIVGRSIFQIAPSRVRSDPASRNSCRTDGKQRGYPRSRNADLGFTACGRHDNRRNCSIGCQIREGRRGRAPQDLQTFISCSAGLLRPSSAQNRRTNGPRNRKAPAFQGMVENIQQFVPPGHLTCRDNPCHTGANNPMRHLPLEVNQPPRWRRAFFCGILT